MVNQQRSIRHSLKASLHFSLLSLKTKSEKLLRLLQLLNFPWENSSLWRKNSCPPFSLLTDILIKIQWLDFQCENNFFHLDYFAPLSESGDYTEKYNVTQNLVSQYQPIKFQNPSRPAVSKKTAYGSIDIQDYLTLSDILAAAGSPLDLSALVNMEQLNINNGNGQSYGYVCYRKNEIKAEKGDVLKISGNVHDIAQVFVNGKLQTKVLESSDDVKGFGYWKARLGFMISRQKKN